MPTFGRLAKIAGITTLLLAVFLIVYVAVHAALTLGISALNHVGNAAAPPRYNSDYEGRFFTYNARLIAALFSPAVAVSLVKLTGKLLREDGYRVPLMVLVAAFAGVGALLHRPIQPAVWQDTALMILETAMMLIAALTLMPQAMATAILKPILVPLAKMIIGEKK